MHFIGIDPGVSGAMSILHPNGSVECIPFDKANYMNALAALPAGEAFCILEKVGAMPHQGVTSMFTFGQNFGWIEGILDCLGIPYQLVLPRGWKKTFSVTADKNSSITVAQRLFPRVDLRRTERSRKPDDNIAESLLMAMYGKRLYKE